MDRGEPENNLQLRINKYRTLLQSDDKHQRRRALKEMQDDFFCTENRYSESDYQQIFSEMQMYVLRAFRDVSEACREQSIHVMKELINRLNLSDFYLTYIFPVLVERIGDVIVVEESEELRLLLLQFMRHIIKRYSGTEFLPPFLSDIGNILSKTVVDKYPKLKQESCECITELAEAAPRYFYTQCDKLTKPVLTAYTHQQFRVRVAAVKCTGDIILHSHKGAALELSAGALAERLFDQTPAVRKASIEVAARLLLEYRDRYSFFYKILPIILTGLNDEVPETREVAERLWKTVGLQYQQENENDLKDQLDFLTKPPPHYPPEYERPNLGCRILVQRHISKILPAITKEIEDWKPDVRIRCAQLLCVLFLHAEDFLTQHLQDIFPAMYRACRDDDSFVVNNVMRASKFIGVFVPVETWMKLVIPAIEDGDTYGHLRVFHSLISGSQREQLEAHLGLITNLLSSDDICRSRKQKHQKELLNSCDALMSVCETDCAAVSDKLFFTILTVLSLSEEDVELKNSACNSFKQLCKVCGLQTVDRLYYQHVEKVLNHIETSPKSWSLVSPERCIFETILLHGGKAIGKNLLIIGKLLTFFLSSEADAQGKLRTFNALSMALIDKDETLKDAKHITEFTRNLVKDILVPNLVWHAGRTAEAMRTMALSCLCAALNPEEGVDLFPSTEELVSVLTELKPLLLSLVEDASSRSRSLSLKSIASLKAIAFAKKCFTTSVLIDTYPVILKRLDDPTDSVRVESVKTLQALFSDVPSDYKKSMQTHLQYIYDAMFIHLDDPDEEFEDLVFDALKTIGQFDMELLKERLETKKHLFRNKGGCCKLLEYLNKEQSV